MESEFEAYYDVVIEGTGLIQSIVSSALCKSGKKILHLDKVNSLILILFC